MRNLRRQFLIDPSVIYLNHGSFGATPRSVLRAYQSWQRQLETQPVQFLSRNFKTNMQQSRNFIGNYLGTSGDNLVFTTNVTEAVNIVAHSLDIGKGDEVLSTNHEYGAMERIWSYLSKMRGFKYVIQNFDPPNLHGNWSDDDSFVNTLWEKVNSRTRVIFLSHITSPTALIFPIGAVIKRARAEGIITVIDGAHAPGQITINLDELGGDFYCGNFHKWLCAPKGAGFLFARPAMQHYLKPLIISWGYNADIPGPSLFIDYYEWTGTRDIAAYLSVPMAIEFQQSHQWDNVRWDCGKLAEYAGRQICDISGIAAFYDQNFYNKPGDGTVGFRLQMISVPLPPGTDPAALKESLYNQHKIEVPIIAWNGMVLIRVSIQGYNVKRDVEKLVYALRQLGQ